MNFRPPYIYVGLYEYERQCDEQNAQKMAQMNDSYALEGRDIAVLRLPSLVWTSEGLASE